MCTGVLEEVAWQVGTCLSEHVAVVAAKVQHRVAAAATEFTWRQQLFTHLADEIGWPLRIDDAQQRYAFQNVCTAGSLLDRLLTRDWKHNRSRPIRCLWSIWCPLSFRSVQKQLSHPAACRPAVVMPDLRHPQLLRHYGEPGLVAPCAGQPYLSGACPIPLAPTPLHVHCNRLAQGGPSRLFEAPGHLWVHLVSLHSFYTAISADCMIATMAHMDFQI